MTPCQSSPLEPLLRKLSALGMGPAEKEAVRKLPMTIREFRAGESLVQVGDKSEQSCIMLTGMTCRTKIAVEGARQITSFHIPGDMPDLQSLFLARTDHGPTALMRSRVALIPHWALRDMLLAHPNLAFQFWRDTLVDGSIFREWLCNIGSRAALSRIAHLICELFVRYRAAAMTEGWSMTFHLTQTSVADAQGLSLVHVNRVMREFKRRKLLVIASQKLTILDWDGLCEAGDFDEDYLHLDENRAAL